MKISSPIADAAVLAGSAAPAATQRAQLLLNRRPDAASHADVPVTNTRVANAQVARAEETREAFTKFVGTTVFGQMLSSMRKTVGEPAYFHGGQAEKVFQGQLDQAIADKMTASGGSAFARAMFEQQFPQLADTLRQAEANAAAAGPAAAASPNAVPAGNDALQTLVNLPRR
ncbi:MAG: rod-binding protein [Planctomycetota bacterium]